MRRSSKDGPDSSDILQGMFDVTYGRQLERAQEETRRLNERFEGTPGWVPGAYGPVYVGLPHQEPKRTFESGATRDVDTDKLDYEGFLSPLVLEEFAKYMHENRHMKDGSLRASDNWQKGMPMDVYLKSGFRHFFDLWKMHRLGVVEITRPDGERVTMEQALGGLMFFVQGYWFELLKEGNA